MGVGEGGSCMVVGWDAGGVSGRDMCDSLLPLASVFHLCSSGERLQAGAKPD